MDAHKEFENEFKKSRNKKYYFIPAAVIAGILVFGGLVMLLWNALLPEIIGVKPVSFWQALGILLLSKILFGGFHGSHHRGFRPHSGALREKWMKLTPEEREKMRESLRDRFRDCKEDDQVK